MGKRSYSLYLWHWPVFSFVDYALFQTAPGTRLGLKIVVTILGTMLTYQLVETPVRQFLNQPKNRLLAFGGFIVAVCAVVAIGVHVRTQNYLSAPPNSIESGGILKSPQGSRSVVVIGDSQGAMYGLELASIANERDFRLNLLSVAGGNELAGEPNTHWPEVRAYLSRSRPDLVIVAEAWSEKLGGDPIALQAAIEAITPYTDKVIVLAQPPLAPKGADRTEIGAGSQRRPFMETPVDRAKRLAAGAALGRIAGGKVEILDLAYAFENPDGSIRLIGTDGRLVFSDPTHLTDTGTALVHDRMDAAIAAALGH